LPIRGISRTPQITKRNVLSHLDIVAPLT
jgi:hypothetical protein